MLLVKLEATLEARDDVEDHTPRYFLALSRSLSAREAILWSDRAESTTAVSTELAEGCGEHCSVTHLMTQDQCGAGSGGIQTKGPSCPTHAWHGLL